MMKHLVIFGDQTAREIKSIVQECYQDRIDSVATCFVGPAVSDEDFLRQMPENAELYFMLGLRESRLRDQAITWAESKQMKPFTVIHPSAYVSPEAEIGQGCFLAPQTVVGHQAKLGDHCLVHFHVSVGHDAVIGDHCWLLPGARISGNVSLGERSLVGSNAFVFQGVKVGCRVSIDALTYVRDDVPSRRIVSGRRQALSGEE